MPEPTPNADAFGALFSFFVDEGTLGDTLLHVVELACKFGPADMAGVTMLIEGRPRTAVSTDPRALEVDAAQYEIGSGPCLDAFRLQQVFRIDSTTTEDRWEVFAKDAAAHGVFSTLSLPISARGEALGALNLYSFAYSAFDNAYSVRMQVFAQHAAILLSNSQVYWDSHELNRNLKQALRSRAVIDQAVGILMATGGRTANEAFELLFRASQRENRKLREIAQEIVNRATDRKPVEAPDTPEFPD
jgi:GAF domain-containing protein